MLITTGAIRYLNAFFGQGTGPIYLDDFLCTGRESRLVNCRNGGLNRIDFCRGHLDDAGVRCAESEDNEIVPISIVCVYVCVCYTASVYVCT